MPEREYRVWSVYKVRGEAIVTASSAQEAIRKGLDPEIREAEGIEFFFSDAYGETAMRAELIRPERDAPKFGRGRNA
ncbi:hypothetical protein ACT17_15245 [Mycolicibacterium conceptionense]|uniref:Uncharacterized protein n=1 Tax=Mycolicibacterium conceptionense TaxID=451644 RepID=A0A0J8U7X8_9MYCO|nr:hypothetical protein [Mycolicibacterium conceptionense]KMV17633.1 hypothetical protein ACT17_15245 [Mycolicibacterium conceptionense]